MQKKEKCHKTRNSGIKRWKNFNKKIRDSINNNFNQFRKISSNGNIKSKYILLFICAFMLSF